MTSFMNENEAMQVLTGIMLGDAGIYMNGKHAYLQMAKSGEQYLPYLENIKYALSILGIEFCTDHPKCFDAFTPAGEPFIRCQLSSLTSSFLLEQRNRWYPNGIKIVPKDIVITPISLAYWFMDDGTASWQKRNLVKLNIATDGFNKEEVYFLRELIAKNLNIQFSPYIASKVRFYHMRLWLLKIEEVNLFFDVIEPYILPCYRYKVKRPKVIAQLRIDIREQQIHEDFMRLKEAIVK